MFLNVSESATANPYLDNDGHVNWTKIQALSKKTEAAGKKSELKCIGVFYAKKEIPRISLTTANSKDSTKRFKYTSLRAQQIRMRKTMPKAGISAIAGKVVLVDYDGLDKALAAEVKKAISAIGRHNTKSVKVVEKVKGEKADIRESRMADFDKNLVVVKEILLASGIKDANIFEGRSMFGKTVFVKLPNGGVVTIGASDIAAMTKAKRAAAAAV